MAFRQLALWLLLPILLFSLSCIKTSGSFNEETSQVSFENIEFKIKRYTVYVNRQLQISNLDLSGTPPYLFKIDQGIGNIEAETGLFQAPSVIGFSVVFVQDGNGRTGFVSIEVVDDLKVNANDFTLVVGSSYLLQVSGGKYPYSFAVTKGDLQVNSLGYITAGATVGPAVVRVTDNGGNFLDVNINVVKHIEISPAQFSISTGGTMAFSSTGGVGVVEFSSSSNLGLIQNKPPVFVAAQSTGTVLVAAHDEMGNLAYSYGQISGMLQISPSQVRIGKGDSFVFEHLGGIAPFIFSVQGRGSIDGISGLYTAPATSGTLSDRIVVTDSRGNSSEALVSITESIRFFAKNKITQPGAIINFNELIDGGTPPYTLSCTAGSIDNVNLLFKAPEVAGNYVVTITDSSPGTPLTTESRIFVYPRFEIIPAELNISIESKEYFTVHGGVPPYVFSIVSGKGSIEASNGLYAAGSLIGEATVRVKDAENNIKEARVYIQSPLTLSVNTQTIETGGTVALIADGGVGPYDFTIVSGEGQISTDDQVHASLQSSSKAGIIQVEARDTIGNRAFQYIQVLPKLSMIPLAASIKINREFLFGAQGGLAPYTFQLLSGSGTISSGGNYRAPSTPGLALIRVSDSQNRLAEANVIIYENIQLLPTSKVILVGRNLSMSVSGGVPPYGYSIQSGNESGNIGSDGVFTATQLPGSVIVHVIDADGNFSDAVITVSPALQLNPSAIALKTNKGAIFTATGGIGPYKFSVLSSNGGAINAATGEYTAPNSAGNYQIQVKDAEGNLALASVSVSSSGNNVPESSAPDHLIYIAGNNQVGTVMSVLPTSLQVMVVDASGLAVTGATLKVSVTSGSGNPGSSVIVSGNDGVVATPYFLGSLATTENIRFEANGTSLPGAPAQLDFSVTALPGAASPATSIISATPNTNVPANGTTGSVVTVMIRDLFNNPIPNTTVTLISSGTGNNLLQNSSLTNSLGVITATLTSTVAENKTLGFAAPSQLNTVNTMVGFGAILTAGTIYSSIAGTDNIVADGVSTATITIHLADDSGNPASGLTPSFTATDTNSTNVYGACSLSNYNGDSFCILKSTKAEIKILAITAPINKSGPSVNFVNGPATKLAFSQQPVSAAVSVALSPQPIVEIQDTFGNTVTTGSSASASLNLTLYSGSGTLLGTSVMNLVSGVADFIGKGLSINEAGVKNLRAYVGSLNVTSSSFSITSVPVSLAWIGSNSIVRGECGSFSVAAYNALGGIAYPGSDININLSGAGTGSYYSNGTCSSPIVATTIFQGNGSRSLYYKNLTSGTVSLAADSGGLSQGTHTLSVLTAPPSRLALNGPNSVLVGSCSSAFTVETQDDTNQVSAVQIGTFIDLAGKGSGSFFDDASCANVVTQIYFGPGTSSGLIYFKDDIDENLNFTVTATGLSQGSLAVTIKYPDLYLSGGTTGSTLDGVAITSCAGTAFCNATNPFDPYAVTTASVGTPFVVAKFNSIIMANSAVIRTSAWNGTNAPAPGNGVIDLIINNGFNMCLNCSVTMSSRGYTSDQGSGKGTTSSWSGGGGAYGGKGGQSNTSFAGGVPYDSLYLPDTLGSGGGSAPTYFGGTGGGLIKLTVNGNFTFNGKIEVNGGNGGANGACSGTSRSAGGGAGGGIRITTNTLSGGGGIIQANGGIATDRSPNCGWYGGGGGGGRIALYYNNDSYASGVNSINFQAFGGSGYAYGSAGTVYYKNNSSLVDHLTLDQNNGGLNNTIIDADTTVANLTLKRNAYLELAAGRSLLVTGTMNLAGAMLTNRGTLLNPLSNLNWTLENYGTVTYQANNLNIKSGGNLTDYMNNTFNNMTIESGGTLTMAVMPNNFTQIDLQNGGTITHVANTALKSYWIDINVTTLTLNGIISASRKGYAADQGPGKGAASSNNSAGGAYGGKGGQSNGGMLGGATYDNLYSPDELGSGGGSATYAGGAGGGLVKLSVSGNLIFNGKIESNGGNGGYNGACSGTSQSAGGGAGGGIKITTNTLSGAGGILQANGGISYDRATGGCGWYGGGGGGGRIALYFNQDNYASGVGAINFEAFGATGFKYGSPGSIYHKNNTTLVDYLIFDQNNNPNEITLLDQNITVANLTLKRKAHIEIAATRSLLVSGTMNYTGSYLTNRGILLNPVVNLDWTLYNYGVLTYPNNDLNIKSSGNLVDYVNNSYHDVIIENGGTQTLVVMPTSFNHLEIQSGGILTHWANTNVQTYWIDINANLLTLNGMVSATSKGFTADQGVGKGASGGGGSGGGAYGGNGGNSNNGILGGTVYDSLYLPNILGSGGGTASTSYAGGTGGGLVKIVVNNNLILNGRIESNGGNGSYSAACSGSSPSAGGGSGGGIYVSTNTLSGAAGIIQAIGGYATNRTGSGCGYYGGGGGGGRIALTYNNDSYTGGASAVNFDAAGGAGSTSGVAGTIYLKPKLSLNFSTGSLSPLVSFSRSSSATYFDSAGIMQIAGSNTPRFDYEPSTQLITGLLLEEARTNQIPWSEAFENASWTTTDATVAINSFNAPDNNLSADKLVESVTTNQHSIWLNPTLAGFNNYSFAVFAKAAERSWFILSTTDNAGVTSETYFDISAGTLGTVSANHKATIKLIKNGWYRISVLFNSNSGVSTAAVAIALANGNGINNYLGTASAGAYIWGAQLENGDCLTSYIPTIGTPLARSADLANLTDMSWFDALKGTFYLEVKVPQVSNTRAFISLRDGGIPDYYQMGLNSTGLPYFKITNGGTEQANITSGTWSDGDYKKMASRFGNNLAEFSVAGVTPSSDNSLTLPTSLQSLILGGDQNTSTRLNGHIKRLDFIPHSLTKTTIQQLSQ
jgi:hypothetical protein